MAEDINSIIDPLYWLKKVVDLHTQGLQVLETRPLRRKQLGVLPDGSATTSEQVKIRLYAIEHGGITEIVG